MPAEDDLLSAVSEMRSIKSDLGGLQTELSDLNARRIVVLNEITRLQALFVSKRNEAKNAASQL